MDNGKERETIVGDVYDIICEMVGYGEDIEECKMTSGGLLLRFSDKTEFIIEVKKITKG